MQQPQNLPYPQSEQLVPHFEQGVLFYTSPLLDQFSGRFRHAFSSAIGGVSAGCFATLNLGAGRGDDAAAVRQNWQRFGAAVGFDAEKALLSRQTHSTELRLATEADCGKGINRERDYDDVDGWLITQRGLPCISQYADCVPIVFYAADRNFAANVHAGWRGTANAIAALAVLQLAEMGCETKNIYAAMGPSAGPCCYEVDEDVAAAFRPYADEEGPVAAPWQEKQGKFQLDLWRANRTILMQAGLPAQNIAASGICTVCNGDLFYSQRRQGEQRGAMSALAMLL